MSPNSMPAAFAQLRLSPEDTRRSRGLPWPPWLATEAHPEVAGQLQEYAAQLEMSTVLLAAQVLASTLCTAQHCAWILRYGGAGCGPVCSHEAAALACARAAFQQRGGATDPYLFDLAEWLQCSQALRDAARLCTILCMSHHLRA